MFSTWPGRGERLTVCLLVVQLKTDTQNGVPNFVLSLPDIEQSLAEITAQVQVCPDTKAIGCLVPAVIEPLAQLPTAFPCHLVGVGRARVVEYPLAVNGTEVGERVAQRPALLERRPESTDFTLSVNIEVWTCHVFIVLLSFGFMVLGDVCGLLAVAGSPTILDADRKPLVLTFQATYAGSAQP